MELTNSKQLVHTASYVSTRLTPDEQHHLESQPGGGYVKANLIRSLNLKTQHHDCMRAGGV